MKMTRNEFCKGAVSVASVMAMHGIGAAEVVKPKQRASRNRTLTLDPAELPLLEKMVSSGDDVAKAFADDMIVNANVMDCLDCPLSDRINRIEKENMI